MINYLEEKFNLTKKGSENLIKGMLYTALLNISLMLPVGLYALLLYYWINPLLGGEYVNPSLETFIPLILVVLGIIFAFAWKQYHFVYNTTYTESEKRRINLGEKLRKLPLSYFENKDLTDLTSTIMNDCTDLEHVFSHAIPQLAGSLISLIIVAIGLLIFNWKLAIALLWVVPVAFIILYLTKNYQQKGGKDVINKKLETGDSIQEYIDSIRDLKSYKYEIKYQEKIEKQTRETEKLKIKSELKSASGVITGNMILKLGIVSVILVGTQLIIQNQINIYTLLIFLIASSIIYTPIENSLMYISEIFNADLKIERAKEIENTKQLEGKKEYTIENYDISFENVSFKYDELKTILEDISFTAKQGEVTALVGPSGGGKTTITKLAARFWDPTKGKVKIGNQNLKEIDPEKLLENYSIVFQEVTLFNNTILENIRVGNLKATDEEVKNAAKLAECEEFIEKLPEKYNTNIGENGTLLSGGQRQRISIARAILKNSNIILLDEATSFLDSENETKIQKALTTLIQNKTVLIIAHRMRTILNSDKIIVLDEGKIKEEGTPEELLKQDGLFKKMMMLQKEGEKWEI